MPSIANHQLSANRTDVTRLLLIAQHIVIVMPAACRSSCEAANASPKAASTLLKYEWSLTCLPCLYSLRSRVGLCVLLFVGDEGDVFPFLPGSCHQETSHAININISGNIHVKSLSENHVTCSETCVLRLPASTNK